MDTEWTEQLLLNNLSLIMVLSTSVEVNIREMMTFFLLRFQIQS